MTPLAALPKQPSEEADRCGRRGQTARGGTVGSRVVKRPRRRLR